MKQKNMLWGAPTMNHGIGEKIGKPDIFWAPPTLRNSRSTAGYRARLSGRWQDGITREQMGILGLLEIPNFLSFWLIYQQRLNDHMGVFKQYHLQTEEKHPHNSRIKIMIR